MPLLQIYFLLKGLAMKILHLMDKKKKKINNTPISFGAVDWWICPHKNVFGWPLSPYVTYLLHLVRDKSMTT